MKGLWGVVREKKSKAVAIAADEPVAYDEVFAKIQARVYACSLLRCAPHRHSQCMLVMQAATGITHVEELVAAFVSAEDHNFSMFNYVNELNKEAEKLEEQATELQQEIQRHTGAGASENSFRKRIIQVRCLRAFAAAAPCAAHAPPSHAAGPGREGCRSRGAVRGA